MLYCMNWLTYEFWTRTGGWEFDRSHGADTSSPSYWQQVEEQAPKHVGWMMCFLLMTFVPALKLCVNIYMYIYIYIYVIIYTYAPCSVIGRIYTYNRSGTPLQSIELFLGSERFLGWMPLFIFFGLPIASCYMINRPILGCLWPLVFVSNNILTLGIWRSAISNLPGCFFLLDLLSEYRIRHGAIGPLYVTSSYSTWIFCRGVSGFATDCPCGVWCHGLTTRLLHVGPPFGNRLLNKGWAVCLTWWIGYLHF